MLQLARKAWLIDLAQTLFRSWWTFVAAASFGLAGGILALQHSPKLYEATTTVWMSQAQIPASVAETPVKEDLTRRLMAFTEADLDQPHMIQLIETTFGLPETDEELRSSMLRLRGRMSVTIMGSRRRGITTFALTYRGDTDPQRTAAVVNTLTSLYISQNEDFRASRAEKTAETISSLAGAVKPELDEIDGKLIAFRRAHRFETKADVPENQRMLDTARRELGLVQIERAGVEAKQQGLEAQLQAEKIRVSDFTGTEPSSTRIDIDPVAVRLAALQRELDEMRIHYSEVHPSFLKKKREIEELLRQARTRGSDESEDSTATLDPAVAALQAQVDAVQREAEVLDQQEARLRKDIAEYRRRIAVYPEVQQRLDELSARRNQVWDRYQRLQVQAENAKGSADLEEERMLGRQMEVLEFASVPTNPYAPQPLRFYGIGVVLGCLLFVGPLLVRSLLSPIILSEEGFRALSDVPVLVSIPNLDSSRGVVLNRLFKNLAFSVLSGAVLVATKLFFIFNS